MSVVYFHTEIKMNPGDFGNSYTTLTFSTENAVLKPENRKTAMISEICLKVRFDNFLGERPQELWFPFPVRNTVEPNLYKFQGK